ECLTSFPTRRSSDLLDTGGVQDGRFRRVGADGRLRRGAVVVAGVGVLHPPVGGGWDGLRVRRSGEREGRGGAGHGGRPPSCVSHGPPSHDRRRSPVRSPAKAPAAVAGLGGPRRGSRGACVRCPLRNAGVTPWW